MADPYARIAFTDEVRRLQEHYGTRIAHVDRERGDEAPAQLGPREARFIAARDSFYLATVSETGWPYVQHRGGPPGFLKVLGPATLGYADFRGNLQYVSIGNLGHDGRVALFLVDYRQRLRLKVLGHARSVDIEQASAELAGQVDLGSYFAEVERAVLIDVGFDIALPAILELGGLLAEAWSENKAVEHRAKRREEVRKVIEESTKKLADRAWSLWRDEGMPRALEAALNVAKESATAAAVSLRSEGQAITTTLDRLSGVLAKIDSVI